VTKRYYLLELDSNASEHKMPDLDQGLVRCIGLQFPNVRLAVLPPEVWEDVEHFRGSEVVWDGRTR